MPSLPFDNSYARLPDAFRAHVLPTPVAAPRLLKLNVALATTLGLDADALAAPDGLDMLAGNRLPAQAEPIAAAYAGHQFGHFVPELGDGRAILLGEIVTPQGERRDIQLKGSGPTPFSRRGDGRAALGPVLREYIVSEAMHALGVPTTRALAAVATGESVYRETIQPGAIFTRVAASHLRVGSFQYFAARGDVEGLRILADYAIARHDPALIEARDKYAAFLEAVIARQARLVAHWLCVGFIHGVMNTDNMTISGETIDYGPCAFMEAYDPAQVFSSIDRNGRYAYANQPAIAQWNLARLAEALLPLFEPQDAAVERANAALATFKTEFQAAYLEGLRRKLGLADPRPDDGALAFDLLDRMAKNRADFTLVFRRLCDEAERACGDAGPRSLFVDPTSFDAFAAAWRARLDSEGAEPAARAARMRSANPAFIPRNHRVEAAIQAAMRDDLSLFEDLLAVTQRPYDDQPGREAYLEPAQAHEAVTQTFCGT